MFTLWKSWFTICLLILISLPICSCNKPEDDPGNPDSTAYRSTKDIHYNGVSVRVVIDKPQNDAVDVLLTFHGTVAYDSKILEAANNTLDNFKRILDRSDMMIVSVAYPEENLLMGDNLRHCEAALLWVKYKAEEELGIKLGKIFLAGHSQGGYLVTRLNTLHQTNGVIANGPGPLNLVFRCQLEENGQLQQGIACNLLNTTYGATSANPEAYHQRSLLNFTSGYKSDILFVQGLNDSPIQMYSWPTFKQEVTQCSDCREVEFLELPNAGHGALFESAQAKTAFNRFINSR